MERREVLSEGDTGELPNGKHAISARNRRLAQLRRRTERLNNDDATGRFGWSDGVVKAMGSTGRKLPTNNFWLCDEDETEHRDAN